MLVMVPCSEEDVVVLNNNPTPKLMGNAEFLWFYYTIWLQHASESTKWKKEGI